MLQVDTLYKRLTPAHISLSAWLPSVNKTSTTATACQIRVKDSSTTRGKYCVAAKALKLGDIVLKEEPFIRQLNHNLRQDHCYTCFREIASYKKVKCHVKSCRWRIAYCSTVCEKKGWSSSHAWTCRFPEFDRPDYQDLLFALEGYIVSRSRGSSKFDTFLLEERSANPLKLDVLPGLVSNLELNDAVKDYREKISPISALFHLSNHIIESIISIFSQIRCNTFAIKEEVSRQVDSTFVVSRESLHLGQAIYLSASRFNHACDPTALVMFGANGNPCQMMVQNVKGNIGAGQEVTISYGPLAAKQSKEERQKILKEKYLFDCQCSACQDTKEEDEPNSIYKCQICKVGRLYKQQETCRQCDQKPYWAYFLKTEAEIENFTQRRDFLKVLQLQENIYHDNTFKIGETLDKLAQIACVSGQMQLAANYSKRSLEIIKKVYGKISVEAAEEMMKLSTLMCNTMQNKAAAIKQIQETMVVYRILGLDKTAPEDIEELQNMRNHLMFIMR